MVEINLLSCRKEFKDNICFYFIGQPAIIFSIFFVILASLFLWHKLLEHQIDIITKQTKHIQHQIYLFEQSSCSRDVNKIKQQKQQQMLQQITQKFAELKNQRVGLVQVFERLHRNLAVDFHLTKVVFKDRECKIFGILQVMQGMSLIVRNFAKMRYYTDFFVRKIIKHDDGYEFVLSLV